MENKNFLAAKFGIEVEFTGITRRQAAEVAARYLGGTITETRDSYGTCKVTAPDGRVWKFVYDGSIYTQKKINGEKVSAGREYSVELVSPILTYEKDMATLQELIRKLRKAGAFSERHNRTGVHIHLNGADHTPRSLRNFINTNTGTSLPCFCSIVA
jgi:hypothetical protein